MMKVFFGSLNIALTGRLFARSFVSGLSVNICPLQSLFASCVTASRSVSHFDVRSGGFAGKRLAAIAVALVLYTGTAGAANIPNFNQKVDFNVREQNVNDFVRALFQKIDVPLSIGTPLDGNVNGRFRDTAGNVFEEISNAFSLIVYYDGAVAHTYRKNEISRRVVPVGSNVSGRVISIVNRMNLPDSRNTIQVEDSGLLLTGTAKFLQQVEEIVESVNSSPKAISPTRKARAKTTRATHTQKNSPMVYRMFKLKHAWANDTEFPVAGQTIVIPGVATILNQLVLQDYVDIRQASVDIDPYTVSSLKGKGLKKSRSLVDEKAAPSSFGVQGVVAKANSQGPRIVADTRLNAIIIRDNENKMPAYERLIAGLDIESEMVEIEATIIDINTDKTRELGVNWRYQGGRGDVLFGSGTAADQALIPGGGPITRQGQGGVLSLMLGEPANFLARVRLLEQQGAARVVSKPHVITLSDVEAVLAATTEFFVRVAGDQEVDLFNVPVGTTLRVTPHIFRDNGLDRIKLLVNIEDGSQTANTQVDSIPVIERANISTQAVINAGDSLLVGGLVRDSYRNSRYQVPVLGRIPLVGGLFRSKQNKATRVERLFLITPRLASNGRFGAKDGSSTLAGDQNRIVQEAGSRISQLNIPERAPMTYWSRQSRTNGYQPAKHNSRQNVTAVSRKKLSTVLASGAAPISQAEARRSGKRGYPVATITNNIFRTPFKVEKWSMGD